MTSVCYNEVVQEMTRETVFKIQPELCELEKKLGALGGRARIELTSDRRGGFLTVLDVGKQVAKGAIIPYRAEHKEGRTNECHGNSIALFDEDEANIDMSGFALANDGKWYHHSWCSRTKGCEVVIVETVSEKFEKYFGIEYRGRKTVERLRDWLQNAWPAAPEIKPGSLTDRTNKILQQSDEDPGQVE